MKKLYPFNPDWEHEHPPGDSIYEQMCMMNMSELKLAGRMEVSLEVVQQLLKGEALITPEIAEKLHVGLGIAATFWLNMEKTYRDAKVKEQRRRNEQRFQVTA